MVILFGLSIIEVLISIRLYKIILNIDKIEKKKRKNIGRRSIDN